MRLRARGPQRIRVPSPLVGEEGTRFGKRLESLPILFLFAVVILFYVEHGWCDEPQKELKAFRICADPNNLPFSNQKQEGFENKLAELFAHELDRQVTYTWWPQRRGFIRNTLNAGRCDVVMGVPAGYEMVLTTRPYYRSTYVFVYPKTASYQIASLDDTILQQLRIGVHLIGDDYTNSPPAHALSVRGIVDNVVGYSVFGDYAEDSPPGKIIEAVVTGEIDTAIVWGPIAGYFAQKQHTPLTLVPVPPDANSPHLPFAYEIALGVRRGNEELRAKLNELLDRKAAQIREILEEYGVPLVGNQGRETQPQESAAVQPVSNQPEGNNTGSKKLNPYTGDAEAVAEGKELYKMLNCYGCHGMRGGGGMGPNITDDEWKEGDGNDTLLMAQLMEGRANMPSYKDVIDEEQAWKVIAFVRTLYKGDPARVTW